MVNMRQLEIKQHLLCISGRLFAWMFLVVWDGIGFG